MSETVEVAWLLPDGRGGGPLADGRNARIRGALPGDRVEIRTIRTDGRAVDAEVAAVRTPSPDRRPAPCPHSAACGGCDLDGLAPEARRSALSRMLARTLSAPEVRWVDSPLQEGHRARIKLAVEGGRLGYRAHRSHALVPVDVCRIARPEIAALQARIAAWLAADPARGRGLASVELRSSGRRAVAAFASEPRSAVDRAALAALEADTALDGKPLRGDPTLTLEVDGLSLRASPEAFYQVNLEANALLQAAVRDAVLERRSEAVLDLYAGIGNLGLPLARRGLPVIAVETPGAGVRDLAHNAKTAGLPVEIVARPVERFDPSRTAFDAVILDPPRAGAPEVLPRVCRNRPRTIVYVSCFAPSAARDLRWPLGHGYRLASVSAFDLFPDTHHVEALVVLERTA